GRWPWPAAAHSWATPSSAAGPAGRSGGSLASSESTVTRAPWAIGTLNSLPETGRACSSSAAAACRNTSRVAGAPISACSARWARQGAWATPPRARRAARGAGAGAREASPSPAGPETRAKAAGARARVSRVVGRCGGARGGREHGGDRDERDGVGGTVADLAVGRALRGHRGGQLHGRDQVPVLEDRVEVRFVAL